MRKASEIDQAGTMVQLLSLAFIFMCSLRPAAGYWDGGRDTPDPYTQAMMMSRQAQNDPDLLKKIIQARKVRRPHAFGRPET